jgi:hypothetical protein
MKRPSKKDIRDAVAKLKDSSTGGSGTEPTVGKLTSKKSSQRIRKQGV